MFPVCSSADSLVLSKDIVGPFARFSTKSATTCGSLKRKLVKMVEHKLFASHDLAPVCQYALEVKYDDKAEEDVLADLTNLGLGEKQQKGKQLTKKISKMFPGNK